MVDQEEATRDHVARIVADLSRPEAYPHPVGTIAIEETHASIVFLTDAVVYKIKKPVDFGFLNFSTLQQRHFYCHEELRLNRRLTRGVYLDVVPIVEAGGRLRLGTRVDVHVHGAPRADEPPPVEYAVKMQRLPDDGILGFLVDSGQIDAMRDTVLQALADRLSRFYLDAATGPGVDEWGTAEAAAWNIQENVEQTQPYVGTIIAPFQHRLIDEVSRAFFAREADLFQRRLLAGAVREGHGDLHLAHIFVGGTRAEDLQILDCIEFNPRLRCGDVAVDIAFLSMDLDYHGRPDLARALVPMLAERLRDDDLERLVHFFSIYRAHVRNKVACLRSDELAPEMPEFLVVRREAERYIDLATSYIVEMDRPTVFLVAGLAGTGKSVIARRLARSLGAALISSDAVRKELAGRPAESYQPADWGAGIYSPEHTELTYRTIIERARGLLGGGRSTVLDATFLDPRWRESARDMALAAGADDLLVECRTTPEIVQQRLAQRTARRSDISEADWTIYERQRARYGEALTQLANLPQVVVETDHTSAQVLDQILSGLALRRRL